MCKTFATFLIPISKKEKIIKNDKKILGLFFYILATFLRRKMIHYAMCIVAEHIWSLKKKETLWHESEIRAGRKIRSTEGAMRRYTQTLRKNTVPLGVCY